jgi:hypothetical protein
LSFLLTPQRIVFADHVFEALLIRFGFFVEVCHKAFGFILRPGNAIVIPFNTAKNTKDTVSLFGDIAGAKDKAKSFMALPSSARLNQASAASLSPH